MLSKNLNYDQGIQPRVSAGKRFAHTISRSSHFRIYLTCLIISMVFRNTKTFGEGVKPFEILLILSVPYILIFVIGTGTLAPSTRRLVMFFVVTLSLNMVSPIFTRQYITESTQFAYLVRWSSIFALCVVLCESISLNRKLIKTVAHGFVLGGWISILWMVAFPSYDSIRTNRIQGSFNDPNFMAAFLIVPIAICSFIWFRRENTLSLNKIYALISLIVFLSTILLTFSRSGWIGSLIALSFAVGRLPLTARAIKVAIIRLLMISTVVMFGLILTIAFYNGFGDIVLQVADRFAIQDENVSESIGSDRASTWQRGISYIIDQPIGHGMGQMRERMRTDNEVQGFLRGHSPEVHNVFLQAGGAFGWIGGVYFLLISLSVIQMAYVATRKSHQKRRQDVKHSLDTVIPISAALLGLFSFSLFFNTLYSKELWTLICVVFAYNSPRYITKRWRLVIR